MRIVPAALALACGLAAASAARAQSVTIFGSLSNFDVINDTGQETYGFEIDLDGLQANQISYEFAAPYIRYASPTITPTATGIAVVWAASWDAATQQFTTGTPVATGITSTAGHQCWTGALGAAYATSGCEHFGLGMTGAPSQTTYHWLVADPNNPGQLLRYGTAVNIPAPIWVVQPPAQPNNPPAVEADIPPPPPPPELQFGEATWVKVFKTELPREVGLNELLTDDPVVPQDPAAVETPWKLLQSNPHGAHNGGLANSGSPNSGSRAIVRRYEIYKYTGRFDPLTHEALCIDPTCGTPDPSEIGDYVGAQMAAANIGIPSITVARTGNGTVTGASGKINCGGSCSLNTAAGASVSLFANPGSGNVFSGWSDACAGQGQSCTVSVNDQLTASVTFTPTFTLSVGRGGSGTIAAGQAGQFNTSISCGSSCSAKFLAGQLVSLSATPLAGWRFVNWTGACSGTDPNACTVQLNGNASVQANFTNK